MPAIINSDDGVLSGSSGLKTSGANDGITAFQQNGTESVRITAAGNVGIGTSSPSVKLHVVGNSRLDGNVESNSSAYVYSWAGGSSGQVRSGVYLDGTNSLLAFFAGQAERARITSTGDFQFNSGYGSVATAYGCRAWVNFNGTGTVAIRASGNVTSITDNGVGDYTVNFTTAMPDVNYSIVGSSGGQNSTSNGAVYLADQVTARTTSAFRIYTLTVAGSLADTPQINIAIFR